VQDAIAASVGKDRATIANYLRLLRCRRRFATTWSPGR
jgi:hypothetical protein